MKRILFIGALLSLSFSFVAAQAQMNTSSNKNQSLNSVIQKKIITEKVKFHSKALEGSLEGESPDRTLIVYLPSDYYNKKNKNKRYPVVYGLHGYSIDNEIWSGEIKAEQSISNAFANGVKDMIIVLPNSRTIHNGSMYSSSVTIGNFEEYIVEDVINYIDGHYRTLNTKESRGLVGHSMGGYGTLRLGMKYPDKFAAIYSMSPCCLSAREAPPQELVTKLSQVQSIEEAQKLGWGERASLAVAAAWSPNPNKGPLYLDLPYKDGKIDNNILNKWAANAPLVLLDQYSLNLKKYKAIAIDVGDRDGLKVDAQKIHERMEELGVKNDFQIYPGDHVSGVADRFQNNVLPFFDKLLKFEK